MALEAAVATPPSLGGGPSADDGMLAEAVAVPAIGGCPSDDDEDHVSASDDDDDDAVVESAVTSSPYGNTKAERVSRLNEVDWAAAGAKQSGLQEELSSVELVDTDLQQRVLGDMAQLARVSDNGDRW